MSQFNLAFSPLLPWPVLLGLGLRRGDRIFFLISI
jgi:hypothetical protein